MWELVSDNTAVISMLSGIATALIWLVYLQIIVSGNRRQRRALISINSGAGKNMDTHLVLCNLGFETVYVTDVIAEISDKKSTYAANVTNYEDDPEPDPDRPLDGTLQGPLGTGDCRAIGTVQNLIDRIANENGDNVVNDARKLSIVVIAARESSIGVRRNYRLISKDGRIYLDAAEVHSKRMSQSKARHYRETWGYDVPKTHRN